MEAVPIGQQKKPATHSGYVGHNAETIKVRLHSICFSVKGTLHVSALASNSGDLLKAFIRSECQELSAVPNERIRLLFRGVELSDNMPVAQLTGEELDLHFLVLGQDEVSGFELALCKGVPCPSELAEVLHDCSQGLQQTVPTLTESGCGGTYFLKGKDGEQTLAVFKPKDEEAGAPQNPRGYPGRENSRYYLSAVASAQRAVREVAAYLLDKGHAQVPMTTLARCRHQSFVPVQIDGEPSVVWKLGAFQAFVDAETSENFGYSVYSVDDVHRVGILDLRIVNFDRNQGNLLVQSIDGRRRLLPIDHGCSLPDRLCFPLHDVAWASWPQSKVPFSPEELKYIAELDGEADAKMLAETLGLERNCLRLLELSTLWLQVAARAGCTLHQIATALFRSDPEKPSVIEGIILNSLASARAISKGERLLVALSRSITHCTSDYTSNRSRDGALFDGEIQWTAALEETFRRHCLQEFQRLVR